MKKTGLLLVSALFAVVASTQAVAIYWEGNDDWNGNIGSTDYVDGQSWSDSSNGYAAYGSEPQTGDIVLIGNWGQTGTAATQPILSVAAAGVPLEMRIGGSDGTLGTLDIATGGSVSVDNLNIAIATHGPGTLNVSGGSIIGTALDLGDGNTGIINLTAGLVHVGALTMGAGGSVNLSPGAQFVVNGDQEGATWLSSFTAVDGGTGIQATYDGSAQTTIVAIPEPATMGLVAVFGGAILFIRKKFMI